MALEQSLKIDIAGFFYIIQAKHDIYEEQRIENMSVTPNLSILTKTTFWDVDITKIDWTKCAKWAIRRVLEYGNVDEVKEIANFYGTDKVKEVYSEPKNFRLYDKVQEKYKACRL